MELRVESSLKDKKSNLQTNNNFNRLPKMKLEVISNS